MASVRKSNGSLTITGADGRIAGNLPAPAVNTPPTYAQIQVLNDELFAAGLLSCKGCGADSIFEDEQCFDCWRHNPHATNAALAERAVVDNGPDSYPGRLAPYGLDVERATILRPLDEVEGAGVRRCHECDAPATQWVITPGQEEMSAMCRGCALIESGATQEGHAVWFANLPEQVRSEQNDFDGMRVLTINGIDVLGVDGGEGYCPSCEVDVPTFYEVTGVRWDGTPGRPIGYLEAGRHCTSESCGEPFQFDSEREYVDALRWDADAERGERDWDL